MRLGASSPKTRVRKVSTIVTRTTATACAAPPRKLSNGVSGVASATAAVAEARKPARVMPTWMVARNRLGSRASRATRPPVSLMRSSRRNWPSRNETNAIKAALGEELAAKIPHGIEELSDEDKIVVARARNGVIGRDGGLPWRLRSDLQWFMANTIGKPCVMGRATWQSLPLKPLPGRLNVVLSRDPEFKPKGALVCDRFDEALAIARETAAEDGVEEFAVIGGAALFELALPKAKRIYLTEVEAEPDGDVFFPPFEVAVKQGHARSLMPSYNEVDGIPSHANRWMLHDVLRKEWGFDGTIVSDWQAVSQMVGRHRVAKDPADAARQALAATVDVELPDVETYHTLVEQVKQKRVPEAAIDDAVRRLFHRPS